jgi:DNA glycosylase AlkZ-like
MAGAAIGLRRLVSQRVLGKPLENPADVVRWFGAVQAQDYGQSLWAIGSRLRRATAASVERAIAERRIVRTWLMRGTIHFAAPEDVRHLLALCAPRLAVAEQRRREQIGLTAAELDRCRDVLGEALAGDRRLSRPGVFRLLEEAGVATTAQRGYHILARLARDGLICIGPMEGRQPTFVLLDDWAPRAQARELTREETLADLAGRFVTSRGPVTDRDLARWAGITLADARNGLRNAPELATRELDGAAYWLPADQADAAAPRAGRRRGYLLAGFDEFLLGYKDRSAQLESEYAGRVAPGANGVFKPVIVLGGQIAGTWKRTLRGEALAIELDPFALGAAALAPLVQADAQRYRTFLGLPAGTPIEVV